MKIIKLDFDESINGLAGYKLGQKVFNKQIKKYLDYNTINKIIFPKNIERVSISFIQGFSKKIVDIIGKSNVDKYIIIESNSEYLTNKILYNMKF